MIAQAEGDKDVGKMDCVQALICIIKPAFSSLFFAPALFPSSFHSFDGFEVESRSFIRSFSTILFVVGKRRGFWTV